LVPAARLHVSRRVLAVATGLVVVVAAVIVAITATGSSQAPAVHWTLAWGDDFNGAAGAAPAGWKFDTGQGIFGDGDVATLTNIPGNVGLVGAGGGVHITAVGQGQSWTSARIQTDSSSFAAPAGGEMMVTASIRQPDPAGGLGYWPAFWMVGPGTWPETGEIDIMEGVNGTSQHSGTLHCGNLRQHNPDGSTGPCHEYTGLTSGLLPCSGCQTGYHVYTVIIDRRNPAAQQIRWYLDGHLFYTVKESQVGAQAWTQAVDHGFSIILDLAVGGKYPDNSCHCTTPASQTTSGAAMTVRYVRVYRGMPS